MKRLIVAGDGTWNGALGKRASNVEKLARTVELDPARSGVPQLVLYLAGVGTAGDRWDRYLGGAFGGGLTANLISCYQFLAANYRPGDEIFLIGFSRGGFMVRSLASLITRLGLLTQTATLTNRLPELVMLYRAREGQDEAREAHFMADHAHAAPIRFLGVFDTVGEVGLSGPLRGIESFHDMRLHSRVQSARQALAIDEHRMKFAPWVWGVQPGGSESSDVRQVWFEGDHSDVGGGRKFSGLSDTTLLWMAGEASRCGLVFDWKLLAEYVDSRESRVMHSNMNALWWTGNLGRLVVGRRRSATVFEARRRRLNPPGAVGIRVAESTLQRYRDREYTSDSLACLESAGVTLEDLVEPLFRPVRAKSVLIEELREWGAAG